MTAAAGVIEPMAGAAGLVQISKRPRHRRSLGTSPLTVAERAEVVEIEAELRAEGAYLPMPRTRSECPPPGTACQHIRCRHSLVLDVADSGAVKVAHLGQTDIVVDLGAMTETCSLRVADRAAAEEVAISLEAIGELMGLSLERVRQIESDALTKLRRKMLNVDGFPPALHEMIARLVAEKRET